jgi:hypothetical protein
MDGAMVRCCLRQDKTKKLSFRCPYPLWRKERVKVGFVWEGGVEASGAIGRNPHLHHPCAMRPDLLGRPLIGGRSGVLGGG